MVHLAALRIAGFKSFVEPTELPIEIGLTGIVGPNGCGKSNLIEALRWGMGENSAQRMRGQEMEDVIFGGTVRRAARNLCEVSIQLDNSDHAAPAPYHNQSSLEIVRRLQRGQGSNYKINGRHVRARDVQTIFADIATGAKSVGLVSQGQINELIMARPQTRRLLLEEAAGIAGLHSRRYEAELRLKAAAQNLERLDDVLRTLDQQWQILKEQAKQAERYRYLRQRIRQKEALLLHRLWQECLAQIEQAQHALRQADMQFYSATGNMAAETGHESDAAALLPQLQAHESEQATLLQSQNQALKRLDEEEKQIHKQCTEANARLEQIDRDAARESNHLQDSIAKTASMAAEQQKLQEQSQNETAIQQKIITQVKEALQAVRTQDEALSAATSELAANEVRQRNLQQQQQEQEKNLARIKEQKSKIEKEQIQLLASKQTEHALAAAAFAISETSRQVEEARSRTETIEQMHQDSQQEMNAAFERLRLAQNHRDRLDSEARGLEALLDASKKSDKNHIKTELPTILQQIRIEPGYEMAFGATLGENLVAPVAPDLESANRPLPERRWEILPAYAVSAALPEQIDNLSSVTEILDPRSTAALSRSLSQIGLVPDAQTAARLQPILAPGQMLATPDGGIWRWDGFVAETPQTSGIATQLVQRNHLIQIQHEQNAAEVILVKEKEFYIKAKQAAETVQKKIQEARQAEHRAYAAATAASAHHTKLSQQAATHKTRLVGLAESVSQNETEQARVEKRCLEFASEQAKLPELGQARNHVNQLRQQLETSRATLSEIKRTQSKLQNEAANRTARLAAIADEQTSWSKRLEDAQKQQIELLQRRTEIEALRVKLAQRPEQINQERQKWLDQVRTTEITYNAATERRVEAENRMREARHALKQASETLSQAREERARCQAKCEQASQARSDLSAQIYEKLNVAPEQILTVAEIETENNINSGKNEQKSNETKTLLADAHPQKLQAALTRLRRELDAMGPVNLLAEKECREMTDKISRLEHERDDLNAAIERLHSGIATLNREARSRLLAAFDAVNANFQALYKRLFSGGRAYLSLTHPADPLQTELEIMASPEGKKLQTLTLLSGGEQALTACALLFAVFQTNPAPICVLDEVDAPLDDTNVDRYCRLLEDFARNSHTRFLVITHHRMTMARMDRLFGVTMMEPGVSRLVSVALQNAGQLQAAE